MKKEDLESVRQQFLAQLMIAIYALRVMQDETFESISQGTGLSIEELKNMEDNLMEINLDNLIKLGSFYNKKPCIIFLPM